MLMLGRNPEEYIVINDNVFIKVVEVDGALKLGIVAPKEVSILRGEVYERDHDRPGCIDSYPSRAARSGAPRQMKN